MELTSYDVQLLREELQVWAAIVRAKAEIDGMNAENRQREMGGASPAYVKEHFDAVIDNNGLNPNSVIHALYQNV